MKSTTLTEPLEVLDRIVAKARNKFGIDAKISLVLGATGGGMKHGHFFPDSWVTSDGEKVHEIVLSGESLERGAVPTLGTLLHELAHAFNYEHEIKDVSDGGRYHNKDFRNTAERMGLSIEKADRIGFSVTTVPAETTSVWGAEINDLERSLKTWRRSVTELAAAKKTSKKYTMVCYSCNDPVVTTKGWFERNDPKCGIHDEAMHLEIEGA